VREKANGDERAAGLRDEQVTYLLATSFERARVIGELTTRNPAMADLLMDLEADDDLRARLEVDLLIRHP
jgi:hypothetical protein